MTAPTSGRRRRASPSSPSSGWPSADAGRQREIGPLGIRISACVNACGHHHIAPAAILYEGLPEQVGTPDAVCDRPATAFVRGVLGEANRIPVRLGGGQAPFDGRPAFAAA